jgi:hypothetical protein
VTSTRPWQLRDVATPEPHYVAPTAAEVAKSKKEHGPGGETPATRPGG